MLVSIRKMERQHVAAGRVRPYQIKRVIAGLDPAIHPLRKSLAKMMDARVKPAHDEVYLYLHIG
jgi:hypothetical protein